MDPAPGESPASALEEALCPATASGPVEPSLPAPVPAEASRPEESPEETPAESPALAEPSGPVEAPAQYPSEHLIRSTSEENQIPSHLPACPSLQHIASLQGSTVIELFHSSIAEVAAPHGARRSAVVVQKAGVGGGRSWAAPPWSAVFPVTTSPCGRSSPWAPDTACLTPSPTLPFFSASKFINARARGGEGPVCPYPGLQVCPWAVQVTGAVGLIGWGLPCPELCCQVGTA